jgi:hypothetical protein
MNETPSLLSQHQLDYELSDDSELRKVLGQWKRKLREVVDTSHSLPIVNHAMRRIFKTK